MVDVFLGVVGLGFEFVFGRVGRAEEIVDGLEVRDDDDG